MVRTRFAISQGELTLAGFCRGVEGSFWEVKLHEKSGFGRKSHENDKSETVVGAGQILVGPVKKLSCRLKHQATHLTTRLNTRNFALDFGSSNAPKTRHYVLPHNANDI
jgi:hypothetical protein